MIDNISCTSEELALAINGIMSGRNEKINSISTSSKEGSKNGHCFFAIKGEKFNGADYVAEAVRNGASVIVTQEKICAGVTTVYVDDVVRSLGLLAKAHKGKTRVIGITGSNGKTTTKNMVASVLERKFDVCKTAGNNNNEIGVPKTILKIKNENFCVLEMGMRGIGQIEWLSYISEPEISIITNCLSAHVGLLGSRENIFKAKCEIINNTRKAVLLPNEERFRRIICKPGLEKIYIGSGGDFEPTNVAEKNGMICFDIGKCKNILINSIYAHDVINATYAYAVGKICGISDREIKIGLEKNFKEGCRGEIITVSGIEIVCDCYNASYESMKQAILSAKQHFAHKRLAVMLGDMLETGEFAKEYHYEIGKYCKKIGVEKLFTHGEYSDLYISGFGGGIKISDFENAEKEIMTLLSKEYALLIKASHGANFNKIIDELRKTANNEF